MGHDDYRYQFNLLDNEVTFNLFSNGYGNFKRYNLRFEGVTTCYFLNDTVEYRTTISESIYHELTSIECLEEVEIHFVALRYHLQQDIGLAQFMLEIWNQSLYIECKTVVINDERFDV